MDVNDDFGITLSVCDTFLMFGIHLFEHYLRQDPNASSVLTDQETIQSFFTSIHSILLLTIVGEWSMA